MSAIQPWIVGWASSHWCQLKVKSSIEQALRDCLVPSLRLGMQPWQALPCLRALLAASRAFPGGTWKRDFIALCNPCKVHKEIMNHRWTQMDTDKSVLHSIELRYKRVLA
ncbi:MAG: hypothetical protein KME57_25215 [Scytonema hyalinum WJT4-NPBG1]|nr:hypothetical protein [Scytonema hyalinum WJT4-NPBG1]